MPLFKYSEQDMDGHVSHNVVDAISAEQLMSDRYKQGQFVFKISAVSTFRRKALNNRELAQFSHEVAVLLASGVPIVRALEIMSNEGGVPVKLQTLYANMVRLLQKGVTIAEAMRMQGGAFPEIIVSVFDSGEVSGKLAASAEKMGAYYENMYKTQQKVQSATAYPKFVGVLTLVIVLILFIAVMPQIMNNMGMDTSNMPGLTRVMMHISNFITQRYILLLSIAVGVGYVFFLLSRFPAWHMLTGRLVLRTPGIAAQLRKIYTARFSTTLSSLYVSGIPLDMALKIAAQTIGNAYVEKEYEKSKKDVEMGRPLSLAIQRMSGLSPRMYQVVAVGEETGKLGEVLDNMSAGFDAEVDTAIAKLMAILSPVLLIFMTAIIGLVMAAVMLPMLTSYQTMGQ